MANVKAIATGNWSNTAIWDTGALPTASDDVYANGFTVTINQAITVLSIRTTSNTGILAGGGFSMTTAYNCSADVIAGTTTCLAYSANGATWIGNFTGGSGSSSYGVTNSGTGGLNITGNLIAGSTGTSTAGYNLGTGTINITGTATGGTVSGAFGANNANLGTINITGTATGGTVSGASGANNTSTGTLTVTTATAGSTVNVLAAGVNGAVQGGTTSVKNIVFGSAGQTPISGFVKFENGTDNTATVLKQNLTTVALSDPINIANNVPSPANVRSGIAYNNSTQTGTLIVPLPSNVANGVPTDNTVGTAILSGIDFWHHLTSNITASSSIGLQMKNNIDATVSSRLATASYTAANNSDITAIKAKTDTLINTDLTGIDADLIVINTGVQKASLLIPHTTNL